MGQTSEFLQTLTGNAAEFWKTKTVDKTLQVICQGKAMSQKIFNGKPVKVQATFTVAGCRVNYQITPENDRSNPGPGVLPI